MSAKRTTARIKELDHFQKQKALGQKPWRMPDPPLGEKWHRNDFTEDMLPAGYRPLMDGELRSGAEVLHSREKNKWGATYQPAMKAGRLTCHCRTIAPLPVEVAMTPMPKDTWQLPDPPPGEQWHTEGGKSHSLWHEELLPPGYRPLLYGEKLEPGDEWFDGSKWREQNETQRTMPPDNTQAMQRTKRPLPGAVAAAAPPWTLPDPPAGHEWQKQSGCWTCGWTEEMLPPGYRPLMESEVVQDGDEYFSSMRSWRPAEDIHSWIGQPLQDGRVPVRTKRPLPGVNPAPAQLVDIATEEAEFQRVRANGLATGLSLAQGTIRSLERRLAEAKALLLEAKPKIEELLELKALVRKEKFEDGAKNITTAQWQATRRQMQEAAEKP